MDGQNIWCEKQKDSSHKHTRTNTPPKYAEPVDWTIYHMWRREQLMCMRKTCFFFLLFVYVFWNKHSFFLLCLSFVNVAEKRVVRCVCTCAYFTCISHSNWRTILFIILFSTGTKIHIYNYSEFRFFFISFTQNNKTDQFQNCA